MKHVRSRMIAQVYVVSCLVVSLLTPSALFGQSESQPVPRLVQFSGVVKDDAGHVKTGVAGVTFALYKDQYGGAPLWLETQNVQADGKGNYRVLLGSTKPDGLPAELFTSNQARWLGVQPEGEIEQPRVLFVSVPYALKAADAETIGGLPPSAFVRTTEPGTNPSTTTAASTNPISSLAAAVSGSGTTNFLPIWKTSTSLGNSTVFETGGKVGIGTTSPAVTLDVNGSAAVRGNQNVTGNLGIGTPPATGPFRLQVATNNQLGAVVQGPFSGVGAGLDLQTTGTGGKQWEVLATGAKAAQGPGKLNIRNLNDGQDVFTIDSLDTVNVLGVNVTNQALVQGNLFVNGATVMSAFGMTSQGPIGIGIGKPAPLAALDILSNNVHTLVGGVSGCNTGFAGVGFGTAGLSDCAHYSLVGDGFNTFLNRPSGGTMHMREGNVDQVVIVPGGNVGIGTTAPLEKFEVAGRMRSSNLVRTISASNRIFASCNGRCPFQTMPNMSLSINTGNVPLLILGQVGGILTGCTAANIDLFVDGSSVDHQGTQAGFDQNSNPIIVSTTLMSVQSLAPGSHTIEIDWNADSFNCGGPGTAEASFFDSTRSLTVVELAGTQQ